MWLGKDLSLLATMISNTDATAGINVCDDRFPLASFCHIFEAMLHMLGRNEHACQYIYDDNKNLASSHKSAMLRRTVVVAHDNFSTYPVENILNLANLFKAKCLYGTIFGKRWSLNTRSLIFEPTSIVMFLNYVRCWQLTHKLLENIYICIEVKNIYRSRFEKERIFVIIYI